MRLRNTGRSVENCWLHETLYFVREAIKSLTLKALSFCPSISWQIIQNQWPSWQNQDFWSNKCNHRTSIMSKSILSFGFHTELRDWISICQFVDGSSNLTALFTVLHLCAYGIYVRRLWTPCHLLRDWNCR